LSASAHKGFMRSQFRKKRGKKHRPAHSGALSSALSRLDGSPPRAVNAAAAAGLSHGARRERR
jgi:hypothetical protein